MCFVYASNEFLEGGANNMCDVLDKISKQGEVKGEVIGKVIGMVLTHASYGKTIKEIAELCEISEEEVSRILAEN